MYKKIVLASALLLALGILIGFVGFPKLMKNLIKAYFNLFLLQKRITLRPGSDTRKLWEKFPLAANFSIYVFSLTNPEDTQKGEKPILKEIGPFIFEEWKDKYNIEDIEDEDTVTFNMRNTFVFRPDLGLSGEELIVMPHPILQFTALSIKRDKAAMLKLIAEGLNAIFKPITPFIRAPFMDLFYRGIDVDCSSDNYGAKAICLNFHSGNVKGAVKVNETFYKFSLMGGGNHSDAGRFKVIRGTRNSRNVGKVIQYDDENELNAWNGDECNRLGGSDSTVFAPLMTTGEDVATFSPSLCRTLALKYAKKFTYADLPAKRYILDLGDVKNEPENHCFCNDFPNDCPLKGTMDLFPCSELPMIASMPHFLNGDVKLLTDVEGLMPQRDAHEIRIDFEVMTGTPLSIANRLQFNLNVEPIEELPVMQDLRPLVMPLFWIEESVNLGKPFTDVLKKQIFLGIKINNAFKWISVICGIFGFIAGFYMMRLKKLDLRRVEQNANDTIEKF